MFKLDPRLAETSLFLIDWPLSQVLLKNEKGYPWFVLVPRKDNIQEIDELSFQERAILIEEINQLSQVIKQYYKPDKLNIGALGNIVSQLHVHLVARFKQDALWPQGIWQAAFQPTPYDSLTLNQLIAEFTFLLGEKNLA